MRVQLTVSRAETPQIHELNIRAELTFHIQNDPFTGLSVDTRETGFTPRGVVLQETQLLCSGSLGTGPHVDTHVEAR